MKKSLLLLTILLLVSFGLPSSTKAASAATLLSISWNSPAPLTYVTPGQTITVSGNTWTGTCTNGGNPFSIFNYTILVESISGGVKSWSYVGSGTAYGNAGSGTFSTNFTLPSNLYRGPNILEFYYNAGWNGQSTSISSAFYREIIGQ
jgi:hypothetical protein